MTQDSNRANRDAGAPDPVPVGRGAEHLPRVLDPVITMGLVQRYIETERNRQRRVLLFLSTIFVLAVLLILVAFVSVGIFLMENSRKAVTIAQDAHGQAITYSSELIGVTNQIVRLADRHRRVEQTVETQVAERAREGAVLKTDLKRFSEWVSSLNSRDARALAEVETRLGTLEAAVAAKEKELAETRKKYDDLLAAAATRGTGRAAQVSETVAVSSVAVALPPEEPLEIAVPATNDLAAESPAVRSGIKGEIAVVTFPNGDRYEGEFQGGLFHGWGIYYYKDGDRYEGEFRNDLKNGNGTFSYRNGDRYVGPFRNDMREGRGSLMFSSGDRYVGEFKGDMISGKGTMLYQNANKYVGDFKNGTKHGNGIFYFANGDTYKGEFRDDVRSGKGTYQYSGGAKYTGDFKDGLKHGSGRYVYASGEDYTGEFKNGKKDGTGVCTYPNGRQVKGLWKDGKFVKALPE